MSLDYDFLVEILPTYVSVVFAWSVMYGKDKWKEKPIDDLPFQYNMDLNLFACCTSKYGNNSELMIVSYVETSQKGNWE